MGAPDGGPRADRPPSQSSGPRAGKARRLLAVAVVVAVAAVAVVVVRSRAPAPPSAPPLAPTVAAPENAPLFSAWLKFEPPEIAARPDFKTAYIDMMLGHQVFQYPPQGLPAIQARELLLDDDQVLLSSGRRLWSKELHYQPGMTGKFCFLHSGYCLKRLFEVAFFIDGQPVVIYDNLYRIERYPSYTAVTYVLNGVTITESRFITYDDRAVAAYRVVTADKKPHQVDIEADVPYPIVPSPKGTPAYPLLASGVYQGNPLFIYIDAPGFTRLEGEAIHLRRSLAVPGDGSAAEAQLAVSFEDHAREGPVPVPATEALDRQRREYNRWFADNVPYFDASDQGFKRMWYYRWWVVRFNMLQANTPDLQGYRFYEGKLGFDNAITFATAVQLKELTYLRDPTFGVQQLENAYRNLTPAGAVVDPPGSPYWGETFSQWIAAAAAEFHRVHPLPPETLRALLPKMAGDVRAWLSAYDADGDGLPERDRPRVTGYDLDILSYWFFSGTKFDADVEPPNLERVDFASFVYANARAVAELARDAGDGALAAEFDATAARIRKAVLADMWDDQTQFFYPQRASDHARAPIREIHGFFPFTTRLAPDEPRYVAALKKLVDPQEFWARYPPVITSQYYYRRWTWDMDGLSRNIAPHPISMGARTVIQVLKHYHQDIVTPDHLMELMTRYNDLVYPGVNPYDPYWRPNVHEYYSKWEPNQTVSHPKPSDISHDFHSMYCALVVEGVIGLTPRRDARIELQPAALHWQYFVLDRLRYQGKDLTILWDQPDGQVRYSGYPEGFSLYIDGKLAFNRPRLGHVIYDPATGTVTEINGPSPEDDDAQAH